MHDLIADAVSQVLQDVGRNRATFETLPAAAQVPQTQPPITVTGDLVLNDEQRNLLQALLTRDPSCDTYDVAKTRNGSFKLEHLGQNVPVFTADRLPGLVLKQPRSPWKARERFDATMRAKQVCDRYALHALEIPKIAQVCTLSAEGHEQITLVEQRADVENGFYVQRAKYLRQLPETRTIAKHLTVLACHSEFTDIKWNNIPLLTGAGAPRAVLVDLEAIDGRGIKDAFITWGEGWGERTPALLGCFPHAAVSIVELARRHLEPAIYFDLEKDLTAGLQTSLRIVDRHADIERFHQTRGITAETPALDWLDVEPLLSLNQDNGPIRAAVADINAVIASQTADCGNLVYAREWRLTGDSCTKDSHWRRNIYALHYDIIDLLPSLQKAGLIHSFLNAGEALMLGVDIRRRVNSYDRIVQF